jgi:methionyl-tRNA synthetase
MFSTWWPANLHIIGKDITRFHTVIWPAMLMSAGLPLPQQVFGHGFMTVNGQRMSKSLGTIVDPVEAAERHGVDPLRLYLTKEVPFGGDGDFSWERYDERYNVDLANNLGNLVSRVTNMVVRYQQGQVQGGGSSTDKLARVAEEAIRAYRRAMDAHAIHEGAAAAFRLVDATNEFIAETAPWALAKDPGKHDRLRQVLHDSVEAVRLAAVLLTPIMPTAMRDVLKRVGAGDHDPRLDRDGEWRSHSDATVVEGPPLWPRDARVERKADEHVRKEISVENPVPAATDAPAPPPVLTIDEFMKLELRVAKVLAAERVPKSTRLLKLLVDVGTEQRTIVAGIAEAYEPDALLGRSVAIVYNLKPAKLMGIESNGMVLAASPDGGKPMLVTFDEPPAPGTRIR